MGGQKWRWCIERCLRVSPNGSNGSADWFRSAFGPCLPRNDNDRRLRVDSGKSDSNITNSSVDEKPWILSDPMSRMRGAAGGR